MKNLIKLSALVLALSFTACAKKEGPPICPSNVPLVASDGRPTVLVIGDSISIGYTPTVKAALDQSGLQVVHNDCNAMTSTWTKSQIDTWLNSRPSFEAITWNNGLWDIANWINTPAAEYAANLHTIAQKIKAKTAHPLFVLSTQVLPGTPYREDANGVAFNQIAVTVMQQEGIPVLDLYSVSAGIQADHVSPTDAHFTSAGYLILGNSVLGELDALYGIH